MTANGDRLETRLARVEADLALLKRDLKQCQEFGWRGVVGSHRGSATFQRIVAEIRRQRREDQVGKSSTAKRRRKPGRPSAAGK
jgi:hypothetical protein